MERNGKRNRKRTKKLVSRIHINEDGDMGEEVRILCTTV